MQYKNMGDLISDLRKQNSMTQKDLADKLNVTDKAVSKWERGLSCPDVTTISSLADVLGISSEQLLNLATTNLTKENTIMNKTDFKEALTVAPKGIALAMGISTLVISILGRMDASTGITLLSIGLSAAGLSLLQDDKK